MTTERWERMVRAVSPKDVVLTALDVTHPSISSTIRIINDTQQHVIGGEIYYPLRFEPVLADSTDGKAPSARIRLDNVGRQLTQWIEAAGGGFGAQVRVFQITAAPGVVPEDDPHIEWSITMEADSIDYDAESVSVRLGFAGLLDQPAVQIRHDPVVSPGAF